MLAHGEQWKECVRLRAVAKKPTHSDLLVQDVETTHLRSTSRREHITGKHLERRALPRTVDAKKTKDFAAWDGEPEIFHCRKLCTAVASVALRVDFTKSEDADHSTLVTLAQSLFLRRDVVINFRELCRFGAIDNVRVQPRATADKTSNCGVPKQHTTYNVTKLS